MLVVIKYKLKLNVLLNILFLNKYNGVKIIAKKTIIFILDISLNITIKIHT